MPGAPELSVVVPGYNEAERLPPSLEKVVPWLEDSGREFELILVDDGSRDRTLEVMREWEARHAAIRVVHQRPNRGKGRALATGVAVSRGALVLASDADFSTPIQELPKLEAALRVLVAGGYRVLLPRPATGSRPLCCGRTFFSAGLVVAVCNDFPGRIVDRLVRPYYNAALRRLDEGLASASDMDTTLRLGDTQCGFKLFRGDLARDVFGHLHTDGFAYDVEVLWRARRAGCQVVEVPVVWRHIEDSRVSPFRHSFQILRDVLAMRLRR